MQEEEEQEKRIRGEGERRKKRKRRKIKRIERRKRKKKSIIIIIVPDRDPGPEIELKRALYEILLPPHIEEVEGLGERKRSGEMAEGDMKLGSGERIHREVGGRARAGVQAGNGGSGGD